MFFMISWHQFERFNTQPPEGGWASPSSTVVSRKSFNTQPPEGGWRAGRAPNAHPRGFNTQPPEGGWQKPKNN